MDLGCNKADRESRLIALYGELLSVKDLVKVFKYSSPASVRRAHDQGLLPVPLYKFPTRRGLFAMPDEVAAAIAQMEQCANKEELGPFNDT